MDGLRRSGYKYYYGDFGEKTGKLTFAQQINDANADLDRTQTAGSLDRSFEYDQVGRLVISHTGAEARAHAFTGQWGTMDGPYSQGYDYDVSGNLTHRYGWGGKVQGGSAGQSSDHYYTYTNNRRTDSGFTYDNAGNLTFDGGQHFSYEATGGQTSSDWTNLQQGYDGDGLRVSRSEDGLLPTRYLRSSVLGGQVVAEIGWASVSWQWARGYVYAGSQLLAVQQNGVYLVHEDAVTKAKRVTSLSAAVQSAVEVDPYGGQTSLSSNAAFQPRQFTTYERDGNGTDEAMARRYNRWHSRFDQPDPYSGSYDLTDPQSFNRYSYTENDPVNFTDPTGMLRLVEPVRQLDGPAFWYLWDASNSGWEPPLDWGRGERPIREPREPQNPRDPCASLVRFNLRDESRDGAPTKYPFIDSSVAAEFAAALQELNGKVNGGIGFNEVFRTSDHQADLYNAYQKTQAAWDALPFYQQIFRTPALPALPPGSSAHEAGLAFDVPLKYLTPAVLVIFEAHGFRRDVPNDPIHLQWMGWNQLLPEQQKQLISAAQSAYSRCH